MNEQTKFAYKTKIGTFIIEYRTSNNRWHGVFNGESLCHFINPAQVADELAGGHSDNPLGYDGDLANLGISDDISDWTILNTQ